MNFIGRTHELDALNRMYNHTDFQMMILYGRRRIGKTTLLNEFAKGKDTIFYTGIESKDDENLREFSQEVFHYYSPDASAPSFRSYGNLFTYITSEEKKRAQNGRLLLIIDEYPYIAINHPELASVLQREIDHEWKNMNMMLVLCGSSITFMEEEVLGEKSPLFGRRTGQIELPPLDYLTSARFVPDYTPEEKAIVYGVTGGIPKYLSMFDTSLSLDENITNEFFSTSGYFYEEPKNLLQQEFRDVSLYFAIVNAVGGGCTHVNEISEKTGFDTAKTSQALRKLEAVRIIRKDIPILNEKNKKLTQYVLNDGMFRFWFRFVSHGIGAIERFAGEKYYQTMVRPFIHEYMGPIFEEICQEYVFRESLSGASDIFITKVGKWRGTDSEKKCPADIDVVGLDEAEKFAVIGECKFKNSSFGKEEYETLLNRGRLVQPYDVRQYLIFSLGGITDWVEDEISTSANVRYISIQDIYTE